MAAYYLNKKAAEQHVSTTDYAREFLFNALNIGEEMLRSGAEVSRVEDSIRRICKAYGAERVEVFVITTNIVVTAYSPVFGAVTQTRRIVSTQYDLYKLSRLNSLSRRICTVMPTFDTVERKLDEICNNTPGISERAKIPVYALISLSFTLFFGGSPQDAAASAVIGVFLKCMEFVSRLLELPPMVAAVFWSFCGGLLANLAVSFGFGDNAGMISIGNIMLLIPGMQLTNSIRDIFSGDTLSALLGFCNAFLLAALIALGFALPTLIF
ncbi:MAG: threonine/serine exporter family protein [Mailhella sp.]|nr:threonine/serine exporter family protein [Mailhella sp.]